MQFCISEGERMHLKIRILDRYIFREVFLSFLFAICAFSAVFIGSGTLFRIAQYITDYGASLPSVIKIFVFSLPGVVMWTFPMSMLLASLLTFGRLSSSSEITAMKSCGVSFYRIAAPVIVLGVVEGAFLFVTGMYWMWAVACVVLGVVADLLAQPQKVETIDNEEAPLRALIEERALTR